MIVLLPPSETKRAGGDAPALRLEALGHPSLTPVREDLVDELVALAADRPASRRALGISAKQDAEIDRNAALWSAPTMPAIDRYTGVLYDALDIGSLKGAAAQRARARLAVGSALFGLLRADDEIPAYRLSAGSKLPGGATLASRWKPALEPVLAKIAAEELVVDLRSGPTRRWAALPVPSVLSPSTCSPNDPMAPARSSVTSTRPTRANSPGCWRRAAANRMTRPASSRWHAGPVCTWNAPATS